MNPDELLSLLSADVTARLLALAHAHNRSILDECIVAIEYFTDHRKSDLPKPPPERDPGIYILRNTRNGRIYIGQTTNFAQRKETHMKALVDGKHPNPLLRMDAEQFGVACFTFEIVERIPWTIWTTRGYFNLLDERERYYILAMNPYYNRRLKDKERQAQA